jgi:hypothetical protein
MSRTLPPSRYAVATRQTVEDDAGDESWSDEAGWVDDDDTNLRIRGPASRNGPGPMPAQMETGHKKAPGKPAAHPKLGAFCCRLPDDWLVEPPPVLPAT